MAFKDLREYLQFLEAQGQLMRIKKPVNKKFDITAYTRKTSDLNGPALLFENVIDSSMPVLSGLFATRKLIALALGIKEDDLLQEYLKRESNLLDPVMAESGPCQEIVLTGDEIDLRKLPILTNFEKDAGPYITGGIQVAKDPAKGKRNVSMHRMLLMGPRTLSVYAPPGRQLGTIISRNEDQGSGTEIATAIGLEPATALGSQARVPLGVDEFSIAGGLRGEPVRLVKCKTIDVEIPDTTEIVIEGRTIPGERVEDGPFGEYPGTYSWERPAPVLEVTAVTMRKNPIYQNVLTGAPGTENHWMMDMPATLAAYREAYKICPDLKDIKLTVGGTARHHCLVSIKKRHELEARNIIHSLLSAPIGIKLAVVVDDDIDINDSLQVEWAINTRVQADRDVIIIPPMYSPTLDPSSPSERTSAKFGIDATMPVQNRAKYAPVWIPGQDEKSIAEEIADFISRNKN